MASLKADAPRTKKAWVIDRNQYKSFVISQLKDLQQMNGKHLLHVLSSVM